MKKILLGLICAALFSVSSLASAEPNDLVRDADGFYTFERSPVSGGWLATVSNENQTGQFSTSYQTGELYDFFKALGGVGVNRLRCKEARGVWLSGFFIAHLYTISDCQF